MTTQSSYSESDPTENVNNLHVPISATNVTRTFHHVNRRISSFVFRLPTETLQAIFIFGASDHHYHDGFRFFTRTPPSWVNVSYVCRHWRSIALNCPTLWTFLFIVSNRWTEELLSRSKQAPLKLRLGMEISSGDTSLAITCLEHVANHAERVQELDLFLNRLPLRKLVFKLFWRAPLLQKVKLYVDFPPNEQDWPPSMPLDTPVLRTLNIIGCAIPWDSFMLRGLTSLTLRYFRSGSLQTMEQFLATLSCMQNLRDLCLESVLPGAANFLSSSAFGTFRKIDLPCLSRLSITAPISTIIALLSCTNIPLETQIRLRYDSESASFPNDHILLSRLFAQRFSGSEHQALLAPSIRSLTIYFGDCASEDIMLSVSLAERGNHEICFSMESSWEDRIPLYIAVDRSKNTWGDEYRIMHLCRSIPSTDIENITVYQPLTEIETINVYQPSLSSAFWHQLLEHFPNVRRLRLVDGSLPDLVPALSFFPPCGDECPNAVDHAQSQLLVPMLEELTFIDVEVAPPDNLNKRAQDRSGDDPDDDDDSLADFVVDVQTLFDALATRIECHPGRVVFKEWPARKKPRVVGRWGGGDFRLVDDDE